MSEVHTAIDFQSGLTSAWTNIANAVPKLLAFLVILIVGWFVAKIIAKAIKRLLTRVGYDRAIERTGVTEAIKNPNFNATDLTVKVIYYVLMLFVFQTAFRAWGPNPISDYLTKIVAYLPKVLVAVVLVVLAVAIARGVRSIIEDSLGGLSYAKNLATAVSALIIVFGVFAALDQLQIGRNVVNGILYATLAAIVGVVVVAVGGGGIKAMSTRWEGWLQAWDDEKPKLQEATRRAAEAKADQAQRYSAPASTAPASGAAHAADAGPDTSAHHEHDPSVVPGMQYPPA